MSRNGNKPVKIAFGQIKTRKQKRREESKTEREKKNVYIFIGNRTLLQSAFFPTFRIVMQSTPLYTPAADGPWCIKHHKMTLVPSICLVTKYFLLCQYRHTHSGIRHGHTHTHTHTCTFSIASHEIALADDIFGSTLAGTMCLRAINGWKQTEMNNN